MAIKHTGEIARLAIFTLPNYNKADMAGARIINRIKFVELNHCQNDDVSLADTIDKISLSFSEFYSCWQCEWNSFVYNNHSI